MSVEEYRTGAMKSPDEAPTRADELESDLARIRVELREALRKKALKGKLKSGAGAWKQIQELKTPKRSAAGHLPGPLSEKNIAKRFEDRFVELTRERILSGARPLAPNDPRFEQRLQNARSQAKQKMMEIRQETVSQLKGKGLQKYAQDMVEPLTIVHKDIPRRIELIDKFIKQLNGFENLEFMKGVVGEGKVKFVISFASLESIKKSLEGFQEEYDHEAITLMQGVVLHQDVTDPRYKVDDTDLLDRIAKIEQLRNKYFKNVNDLSIRLAEAVEKVDVTLDEAEFVAVMRAKSPSVEAVKDAHKHLQQSVSLATTIAEKTAQTKFFVKLYNLVNTVNREVTIGQAVKKDIEKYKKNHMATELAREFDKDPTILAKHLMEKQLLAVDLTFQTIEATAACIGAFDLTQAQGKLLTGVVDVVCAGLKAIVKGILDEKWELTKKAAKASLANKGLVFEPAEPDRGLLLKFDNCREQFFKDAEKDIDKKVKSETKAAVATTLTASAEKATSPEFWTSVLGSAYEWAAGEEKPSLTFDWDKCAEACIDLVVEPAMKQLSKLMNLKAYEIYTGTELAAIQEGVTFAGVAFTVKDYIQVKREAPKEIADADKRDLPGDIGGVKIKRTSLSRSKLSEKKYYVSIELDNAGEVWGVYNGETKEWTPMRIDPESFTDWSDISVEVDQIVDATGAKIPGCWFQVPVQEKHVVDVAFERKDNGKLMWGSLMDRTKGGTRGKKDHQLGWMISRIASEYVTQTPIEELPQLHPEG